MPIEITPSKKTANDFNEGYLYEDGVDIVHADTINNLIESALWTQALATNQPNNDNANKSGLPTVSIETLGDGTSRLKFENLAGITISNVRFELSSQTTTTAFYKFIATLSNGEEVEQDNAIQVPKTQVEISNLDEIFPVGITISLFNDTKPAEIWGGTWEELDEGIFLMSAGKDGQAGQTGGSNINSHEYKLKYTAAYNFFGGEDRVLLMPYNYNTQQFEQNIYGELGKQTIVNLSYQQGIKDAEFSDIILTGHTNEADNRPQYRTAHVWRRIA